MTEPGFKAGLSTPGFNALSAVQKASGSLIHLKDVEFFAILFLIF